MKVIPRGSKDQAVMLCQHEHCNAFGPSTSSGSGCGFMLSLMACVGLDFSFCLVTFEPKSGPVT